MKEITVAILGLGSRGHNTYGRLMKREGSGFRVVSVCDVLTEKLDIAKKYYGLSDGDCFNSEEEFFSKKRADCLVIATQDRDHVRQADLALKLGYDILLEKPISPSEKELKHLLKVNEKYKKNILVCHVLRYSPIFKKIKETLDSGIIGTLVRLESIEQVTYWHQAHSFVRGNWRNEKTTSPMILQKCCHDLDLLVYYVGSKCKSVYSQGSLEFFKKENKPEGAGSRCESCKYINNCIYSAENLYVKRWREDGCETKWPYDVVDISEKITEESLRRAYQSNAYGRCVFECDNNVVDNQSLSIEFENGVFATHTMTAFTSNGGRRLCFHGTHGEIELDEGKDLFRVSVFGKENTVMTIDEATENSKDNMGHGGGDSGIIKALYELLTGNGDNDTSIEKSVESHLIAISAEKSRKTNKPVRIKR